MPFRHGQRMCRLSTRHPVYPSHTMLNRGQFAIVMMRWSACGAFVAGLRAVNPVARPSHCYAVLKDWWEKRFSEVINEIPVELLEKWDARVMMRMSGGSP